MGMLEQGVESVLTSEGYQKYLKMQAKFWNYSFANTILIMAQKPDSTIVNSYKRWQELGRQVERGETGIKILFPIKRVVEDEQAGDPVLRLAGFGIGNVFDVSQTSGEELPEPPDAVEIDDSDEKSRDVNLRLSRFLIDEGLLLESKEFPGNARGFWNPTKRQIVMRREGNIDPLSVGKTKTLAHEAAHYLADHRGNLSRDDAETVAEGSAYVTMEDFGIDTGDYSFTYVASWSKDMEVVTIVMAVINILLRLKTNSAITK